MRPRFCLFLAVLCAAALAPTRARATVVVPLDLSGLTDGAEQVALVRVESQVARFTYDHGFIYTEATVRVVESLKGDLRIGDTVLVRREGGEAEGVGMNVVGAPRFTVGEEAVVFLEHRSTEAYWTVGMAQGRLRVATLDGKRVIVRDHGGLAYVSQSPQPAEPRVQLLDEVRARILERVTTQPRKSTSHAPSGVRK